MNKEQQETLMQIYWLRLERLRQTERIGNPMWMPFWLCKDNEYVPGKNQLVKYFQPASQIKYDQYGQPLK